MSLVLELFQLVAMTKLKVLVMLMVLLMFQVVTKLRCFLLLVSNQFLLVLNQIKLFSMPTQMELYKALFADTNLTMQSWL
jgi:hypothetical protein